MAFHRVPCVHCSQPMHRNASELLVSICEDGTMGMYRFRCPACHKLQWVEPTRPILQRLLQDNAPRIIWSRPKRDAILDEPLAPELEVDYVLDFGRELAASSLDDIYAALEW